MEDYRQNIENEKNISDKAVDFIRKNKGLLYKKFAGDAASFSSLKPVTIFMAGSPGAGKTEISKSLINEFKKPVVRIDADEIRALCPGYTGSNAHLFQKASSIGVEFLYEHCLKRGLGVIIDGTFSHRQTVSNIERSLLKGRHPKIYFIYQDPKIAWSFTKKREITEQRRITKEVFIKGYLMSRIRVHEAKAQFGRQVELNLTIKDLSNEGAMSFHKDVLSIDSYIGKVYSEDELKRLLS